MFAIAPPNRSLSSPLPPPSLPCVRVSVQRAGYETIGPYEYNNSQDIHLRILIRVQPTLDLGPFLDTDSFHAHLAKETLAVTVVGQDPLVHIGNIVAQYLTRQTVRFATPARASRDTSESPHPSTLRQHLPPILVHRSSLLFAVRGWPGSQRSLLLADDIVVDDMVILQDWDSDAEVISEPGQLTLYCVLGSVRVLMDGQGF